MLSIMLFLNQQQNWFSLTAMTPEYDKYGDNCYNTFQTHDKKYECRTGPFEGLGKFCRILQV
jgi:hypothetical protein